MKKDGKNVWSKFGENVKKRCEEHIWRSVWRERYEEIYEERPSIIVATIDKFAQLAFNKDIRSIFGIDKKGIRFCSPKGTPKPPINPIRFKNK